MTSAEVLAEWIGMDEYAKCAALWALFEKGGKPTYFGLWIGVAQTTQDQSIKRWGEPLWCAALLAVVSGLEIVEVDDDSVFDPNQIAAMLRATPDQICCAAYVLGRVKG